MNRSCTLTKDPCRRSSASPHFAPVHRSHLLVRLAYEIVCQVFWTTGARSGMSRGSRNQTKERVRPAYERRRISGRRKRIHLEKQEEEAAEQYIGEVEACRIIFSNRSSHSMFRIFLHQTTERNRGRKPNHAEQLRYFRKGRGAYRNRKIRPTAAQHSTVLSHLRPDRPRVHSRLPKPIFSPSTPQTPQRITAYSEPPNQIRSCIAPSAQHCTALTPGE